MACGAVSAAVRSRSDRICTGVCVDTCAGRNAIFNMPANGEHGISGRWPS